MVPEGPGVGNMKKGRGRLGGARNELISGNPRDGCRGGYRDIGLKKVKADEGEIRTHKAARLP